MCGRPHGSNRRGPSSAKSSSKRVAPKSFILQGDAPPLSSAPVWTEPSQLLIGRQLFVAWQGWLNRLFDPPLTKKIARCARVLSKFLSRHGFWSTGAEPESDGTRRHRVRTNLPSVQIESCPQDKTPRYFGAVHSISIGLSCFPMFKLRRTLLH